MLFRRQKPPTLSRDQVLAAKPVRLAEPRLEETADGGARLTVEVHPTRTGRFLLRLPENMTKTFELDALGLLVWNLCDGKTSVQSIIRKLAKRYNLNLREAEVPTQRFLQMLLKKGLIAMSVPK